MINLVLPIPPSVNHLYVTTQTGRRVLTRTALDYQERIAWMVQLAARTWSPTRADRLALTIVLHYADQRRRDLDNNLKILLDSIAHGLRIDDSQIDRLLIERGSVDKHNPRCTLTIAPMERAA